MPAMSRELQEERNKINFSIEEFTNWFYGGASKVERRRSLERLFLSDPELDLELDTSYLSYKEKYEEAIRRSTITHRKVIDLLKDSDGEPVKILEILRVLRACMCGCINKEGDPLMLQFSMFLFMMFYLTSDEQRAEWIPRVLNCNILGTYAQTELGHGTNVRGLETTATYDARTKEFVINTPSLSAYKFWPGNMGSTVNFAVVMAQLYTNGKCHGVHPFIVQIRDLETHMPMLGVTLGDIGNKLGYVTMNNGFLRFQNVRIPREQMMMRTARVLEDGTYELSTSAVLNYGAMLSMRVSIVHDTAMLMSQAATIATRYSLVRRQSPINPNEPEPKIIEHTTQQQKIFIPLVKSIVYRTVADHLDRLFHQTQDETSAGNLMRLPELHALVACLKSVVTDEGTRDVEICRLACGGHGYLHNSGFDDLYKFITAGQTGEGVNTVMLLQTARYMMKTFASARSGEQLTEGVSYLSDFIRRNEKRPVFDGSIEGILRAVQAAAAGKISLTWARVEEQKKFNASEEEARNNCGIDLARAAELHCHVSLLQIGIEEIRRTIKSVSPALGKVFENILELYAVDTVLKLAADVFLFVDMTIDDVVELQKRLEKSLKYFRTVAIGIVDGFDFSDRILDSTLGAYDGNVYERLLAAAKKSPLNQEQVNKTFHLYLKPFMRANL